MINLDKLFLYHRKMIRPYIETSRKVLNVVTSLASVVFILALVYQYGFNLTPGALKTVTRLYHIAWIIYLVNITFYLFTELKQTKKKYRNLAFILSVLLYFTLLPVIFSRPASGYVLPGMWDLLHSEIYRMVLLTLFSLLTLSNGVIRMLGKRTNPSLILAISFLCLILIGTGLLSLPRSTYEGIAWIDAFFISTSAVCVTGLTPVDISTTFTLEGQIIIILLVQTGGLGVMTLTSFFAVFFMGNTSIYNQLVLRDMVSSDSLNSLLSTLLYILGFTLILEGIGMLFIWMSIHDTLGMSLPQELFFAAFHSVSAFCNAGMSTLPGNLGNPAVMTGHNTLYLTVSFLIILGGIGFPILVNFKNLLFKRNTNRILNLNTRIVLSTTLILLLGGMVLIGLFEWNGAFSGMSLPDKLTHSFFYSVCPRTAGFTSVDLTGLCLQSLLVYSLLMWIGGAAQSTAGGLKVNAVAVAFLNLKAILRGGSRVEAFGREISDDSIRRSNATILISLCILFLFFFILTFTESPDISLFALAFECVAALGTAGSSLNLTPLLSDTGKLLIACLMFIGRIGVVTLLLGIIKRKKQIKYRYPSDSIIIN